MSVKGFPWPKEVPAYHATTALDAVLREGLKSRRELLGDLRHATGGGPDESVSFTLDIRVARAICAGLRTLSLCAKREMSTVELLVSMDDLAPEVASESQQEEKLSNEIAQRLDEGLYGVEAGFGWGRRFSVQLRGKDDMERFFELERQGVVVGVEYEGDGPVPMVAFGWIPVELAAQIEDRENLPFAPWCYDLYKRFLFAGSVADTIYDPFFFMTKMRSLAALDVDQIGIVETRIDADWLCATMPDIKTLGYSMEGLHLAPDWSYGCEARLRYQAEGRYEPLEVRSRPSREWESPDAWDTVYYTGSMAEVRVYDSSLIIDVEERETLDDVMHELSNDWFNFRGIDVEEPIAAPFFKAHQYSLQERGFLPR